MTLAGVLTVLAAVLAAASAVGGFLRVQLEMQETAGGGVGDASVIASLPRKLPSEAIRQFGGSLDRISYQLMNVQPREATSLVLDSSTGTLRAHGSLLREAVCKPPAIIDCRQSDPPDSCRVTAVVKLLDPDREANFLVVELDIVVRDIDNSPPRFEAPAVEAEVLENFPPGHLISLPQAEDPDARGFASCRLRYSLVPCTSGESVDETFRLVESTPPEHGPKEVKLLLHRVLDREFVDRYRYCVTATDSLNSGLVATATVVIRVRDYNDNTPVWSSSQKFVVSVPEFSPPEVLLQLSATDADRDFGTVHYQLQREYPLFYMTRQGELKLKQLNGLDYETRHQYLLIVLAVDNGQPARTATATVTINVLDTNDNRPQINLGLRYKSVVENNPVPLFIDSIDVSDKDPGANGAVSCEVGPPNLRRMFYLELKHNSSFNTIYTLFANKSFDREKSSLCTVTIECSDAGMPALSSSATVYITVIDQNDNPPVFQVSPIDFSFQENTPRGTKVYDIQVLDPDVDSHNPSLRRFVITGEGRDHFQVDYRGGSIYGLTAAATFDREAKDTYRFNLTVYDTVSKSTTSAVHQATVEVLARVIDINDCSPEFANLSAGSVTFEIAENATLGSQVGAVSATDRDLGDNGRVFYSFSPLAYPSGAAQLFRVDQDTGAIYLCGQLDKDGPAGQYQYNLEVLATDRGTPRRTSTASLTVLVVDCNDNRPRFRSPAPVKVNVSCDESVENHILRIDVEADDADATPEFKTLEYRLTNLHQSAPTPSVDSPEFASSSRQHDSPGGHSFYVEHNTGMVTVKSAPRLCRRARYKFSLEVFEPGYPREVSRKDVTVDFEGGDRPPGGRHSGAVSTANHGASEAGGVSAGGGGNGGGLHGPSGNGNLPLRGSDTEGIVIAALVAASVILAAVLILAVVLLRKRLRRDSAAAAAAAAAAASAAAGGGGYTTKGRIVLMPKCSTTASAGTTLQRGSAPPSSQPTRKELRAAVAAVGAGGGCASALLTSPSMDSVVLQGACHARYGTYTMASQPTSRDESFDADDSFLCRMPLKGGGGGPAACGPSSARRQNPQHLQQQQHTYQTVLPCATVPPTQHHDPADVQNAYMTCQYPNSRHPQKVMIDSKRRPSQPGEGSTCGKSPYFTVSFV